MGYNWQVYTNNMNNSDTYQIINYILRPHLIDNIYLLFKSKIFFK